MKTNNTKFEAGKSYEFSWICDADLISVITCIKRTAKTLTFDFNGRIYTRRIKTDEIYGEYIEPTGTYSMSPTCWAGRLII